MCLRWEIWEYGGDCGGTFDGQFTFLMVVGIFGIFLNLLELILVVYVFQENYSFYLSFQICWHYLLLFIIIILIYDSTQCGA